MSKNRNRHLKVFNSAPSKAKKNYTIKIIKHTGRQENATYNEENGHSIKKNSNNKLLDKGFQKAIITAVNC